MASAIVTLLNIALLLISVALLAQSGFISMDQLSDAWKRMEVRSGDIARTELEVLAVGGTAQLVDVTIKNSGQTPLQGFSSWDLVVQYYQGSGTYRQVWLPYTATYPPANNYWTVKGIYANAGASVAEIFGPKIFDPGEVMIITVKLNPPAGPAFNNQIILAATNGITVSAIF